MESKVGLITPFLMLSAGAIASIIMYKRGVDLYTMLWGLLIVLLIFYVIGDIIRYIYASIKPRVIPKLDYDDVEVPVRVSYKNGTGNVIEHEGVDTEEFDENEIDRAEFNKEKSDYEFDTMNNESENENYSDDELEEYSDEDLEDEV